jgi:hypothetical protein
MRYLTNIRLEDKERCEHAARESGMRVEFRNHPMPKDYSDPDDEYYHPDSMVGGYGSIYTHEGFVDHSKFWRAWDEYSG